MRDYYCLQSTVYYFFLLNNGNIFSLTTIALLISILVRCNIFVTFAVGTPLIMRSRCVTHTEIPAKFQIFSKFLALTFCLLKNIKCHAWLLQVTQLNLSPWEPALQSLWIFCCKHRIFQWSHNPWPLLLEPISYCLNLEQHVKQRLPVFQLYMILHHWFFCLVPFCTCNKAGLWSKNEN